MAGTVVLLEPSLLFEEPRRQREELKQFRLSDGRTAGHATVKERVNRALGR